ncbi:MAG: response regulator, partial [Kofleriaceae bacterium]
MVDVVRDDRRRLLLIDDSEIVLAVETALLSQAGFEVRAVSSLRAFINALLDWKPHIIITDLYMPEMSGADLCQWLRQQVTTSRIPIVLCSSAPEVELEEIARSVGADAYLSKEQG